MIVRPRSALGLKYVELTPGKSEETFTAGRDDPARERRQPGRVRRPAQHVRRVDTRQYQQEALTGFGDAFAGRGADLNEAIAVALARSSTR